VIAFNVETYEEPLLREANHDGHALTLLPDPLGEATAGRAAGCEAILISGKDEAPATVLKKLGELGIRFIVTRSAGTDHIDAGAAERLGITVRNIPRYSPSAIAEHAVALMLALGRHLIETTDRIRKNNFALTNELVGFELNGKTAGIVGYGNIGQVLAKILTGFGCTVLAFDNKPEEAGRESPVPVEMVALDDLLERSDVVSLHLPLHKETRGLFNARTFARMKPGAMLINTGRGALVNTKDALHALRHGPLGYLGIDVYEHEHELFFEDRSGTGQRDPLIEELLGLPNAMVTGHQAFLTQEALESIAKQSFDLLADWEKSASR
ncbi:MAG: 2-hydroxyacid dehydrogenase, partial [Cytophagales bacterium]|nr:2-hydroxyacid dehydrogenase [Cytophagales bacterium]